VTAINSEGTIVGLWIDKNNVFHGFLPSRGGALTSFDAPNAGTGPNQGTFPSTGPTLSPLGVSIGQYLDGKGVVHAYVRQRTGTITQFDPPGSVTLSQPTPKASTRRERLSEPMGTATVSFMAFFAPRVARSPALTCLAFSIIATPRTLPSLRLSSGFGTTRITFITASFDIRTARS
jgi:hypothetical protein